MKNKETVCAVVVTYNRKELLIECLDALCKQTRPIDAIYIVDNFSNDGTAQLLLENGYLEKLPPENLNAPIEIEMDYDNSELIGMFDDGIQVKEANIEKTVKIYYVRMNENTGGAGGFYEGVKRGHEKGYDWLWLMDDDAEPYLDSLEILSKYFQKKDIVGLAGTVIRPDSSIAVNHRGTVDYSKMFPQIQTPMNLNDYDKDMCDIHTASFVGILVKSEAISKIGYPIKEYFIHNDDIEYCLRLLQVGKIKLIPQSVILHKEASQQPIHGRIPLSKLWLRYYGRRNLISIARKYSTNKLRLYFQIIVSLIRPILGIIVKDQDKMRRIYFLIAQVIDGFMDNFDNEKPKKILGLK